MIKYESNINGKNEFYSLNAKEIKMDLYLISMHLYFNTTERTDGCVDRISDEADVSHPVNINYVAALANRH